MTHPLADHAVTRAVLADIEAVGFHAPRLYRHGGALLIVPYRRRPTGVRPGELETPAERAVPTYQPVLVDWTRSHRVAATMLCSGAPWEPAVGARRERATLIRLARGVCRYMIRAMSTTPKRGPGRPQKTAAERLDAPLLVHMSHAEREAVRALAAADQTSMGRALVERAVAEAVRRGLVVPKK